MKNILISTKNFILDTLFPPRCLNCQGEGSYLCDDCQSLIEILESLYCPVCGQKLSAPLDPVRDKFLTGLDSKHLRESTFNYTRFGVCKKCKNKTKLNGVFAATSYQNLLVKKLIIQLKYDPLIKELAKPLANLIITHFQLLTQHLFSKGAGLNQKFVPCPNELDGGFTHENFAKQNLGGFTLIPVPLHRSKLKQRGFNQAEEISKELSKNLKLPVAVNVLIKTKKTLPQTELSLKSRKENIKGVFLVNPVRGPSCLRQNGRRLWRLTSNGVKNEKEIKNFTPTLNFGVGASKILLVDDVYTTGSTLEECARVLKEAGAKEIWGVVVAREEYNF